MDTDSRVLTLQFDTKGLDITHACTIESENNRHRILERKEKPQAGINNIEVRAGN